MISKQISLLAKNIAANSSKKSAFRAFSSKTNISTKTRRKLPDDGVTLSKFIASQQPEISQNEDENLGPVPTSTPLDLYKEEEPPKMKFHLKTYGCQMNVSDSDIIRSILLDEKNNSIQFEETQEEMDADVLLTNTCAIRENAEQKVWHRLKELRAHDSKNPLEKITLVNQEEEKPTRYRKKQANKRKRIIGVLGCMAERLKEDMFRDGTADLIVGPDAYRDLPRLINALAPKPTGNMEQQDNQGNLKMYEMPQLERALNVELSFDETYADINPVRANPDDVSAFVSVMRGCNNMCSYCVVPFTRGRERSRELESIVREARILFEEENVKEICLLGQNVNSYHDKSESAILARPAIENESSGNKHGSYRAGYNMSNDGFSNMFKLRGGAGKFVLHHEEYINGSLAIQKLILLLSSIGYYFVDLVEAISDISPELRVRFTSPHPKDYPPELLSLMAERHNVCNHLHMPAQSGSTTVLERMRRGYSREAYLNLIDDVKTLIPDVAISSDFITGFCAETEEEHQDTLSLMDYVAYDQAFMFSYSMRGKTHANRTMEDDVPEDVKSRRLQEVISMFRTRVQERNDEMEVGKLRLVLVEGEAKKKKEGKVRWGGRTDQNKRITFDYKKCWTEENIQPVLSALNQSYPSNPMMRSDLLYQLATSSKVKVQRGDYAVVQVDEARGHVLTGKLLWRASQSMFSEMGLDENSLGLFGSNY